MKTYIAMATGAAIVLAAASYSHAQNTPPGTDRPGGNSSTQSADPKMDKKGGKAPSVAPKTDATPTPPGSDRPAGEGGTTSANPKPDSKK